MRDGYFRNKFPGKMKQLGSYGGGNHFGECEVVHVEDNERARKAAEVFGMRQGDDFVITFFVAGVGVSTLPLTSLVAMVWMHYAGQSPQRLANHAEGTFWFVLPTLPMFLIFPWMLRNGWGFWASLAANCVITVILFWLTVVILRRFGIDLMPK